MIDSLILEGVAGGSVNLYDPGYELTHFDPQYDTRNDETVRVQQDGIWATFDYLGKLTIHMEGNILGSSGADYWAKRMALASVFVPAPQFGNRYVVKLRAQFTGFSEEVFALCQMDGRPDLPITADFPFMGAFQIALKAADPRFYGAAQTATTGGPNTSGVGGLNFPFQFPINFSLNTTTTGGDLLLTTTGNAYTAPVVTITGPCQSPAVTMFDADNNAFTIGLSTSLADMQTATINFTDRTVVSGTGANLYQYVGGTWWTLPPNATTHVKFTCLSADTDTLATFVWQNAYLL